jgi:hypothetical protein
MFKFSPAFFLNDRSIQGDKDIRVRTPDGTLIFFQNTFDPISGGMLEKDVVPDGGFGFYAENIYFPIDGSAPIGDYLYGVSGSGVEAWELSVYLGDEMVDVKKGTGPSEDFNYEFGICDREIAECCTDLDCRNSSEDNTGDLCVARNCIFDGVLRFTLIWEGIGTFGGSSIFVAVVCPTPWLTPASFESLQTTRILL